MLGRTGSEFRETRIGLGLSQAHVGAAVGISPAQVSRIERGVLRHVAVEDLVSIATVLGLDLSVRTFPAGPPIRDVAHLTLLERLRERCGATLRWRVEVPLAIPADQRAWDATLSVDGETVAIEAETRLRDIQALVRRIALKQADDHVVRVILLVAESRGNRDALRVGRIEIDAAFPLRSRDVLAALASGRLPARSGIVIL